MRSTMPTHGHVLIVEDNRTIRETLRAVLAAAGYVVRTAANGQEALEQLRHDLPGCILLDLAMPVMDGREFRHHLAGHEVFGSIPVLLLSGEEDIKEVAQALKAAAYLRKPVNVQPLLAMVRKHCRHPKHSIGSPRPQRL